ncbi:hypothetical protein E4U42_007858 [Claviceps africana]|uniref:MOZ protein represents a chromatin-associated acetyltransferase n=1 Tax=Claviceps africana TaxID=83212 RepID=A0A8K0J186_9HYPO|nr:hypothetical protein E4U42_007858 [Claviceps africana]
MSTGRLTFLYPHLLRTTRTCVAPKAITTRWVATTRCNSSFAPRHGKAVEPTWDKAGAPTTRTDADSDEAGGAEAAGRRHQREVVTAKGDVLERGVDGREKLRLGGGELEQMALAQTTAADTMSAQPFQQGRPPPPPAAAAAAAAHGGESSPPPPPPPPSLDAVAMPSPDKVKHPHMTPPPYVHHFDSYSMVKLLEEGGYSRDQAVSSMKAIRTILGGNLDVAQRSLVSKSDVENEAYLFHAACSELRTEIKNNRRLQEEQMRQQRTHLQHEVDILTQTLNQELLTLNDGVRGLFNDRTMAVREEQKAVESAIQQINYKMSILLSSDCKSEIEGVRWILIRRSVVGLLFLAVLTLGMIRYTTYLAQQRKRDAEQRRRERERLRRDGGRTDNSAPADAAVILSAS